MSMLTTMASRLGQHAVHMRSAATADFATAAVALRCSAKTRPHQSQHTDMSVPSAMKEWRKAASLVEQLVGMLAGLSADGTITPAAGRVGAKIQQLEAPPMSPATWQKLLAKHVRELWNGRQEEMFTAAFDVGATCMHFHTDPALLLSVSLYACQPCRCHNGSFLHAPVR